MRDDLSGWLGIAGVVLGWAALGSLFVKLELLPIPIVVVIMSVGFFWLARVRRADDAMVVWLAMIVPVALILVAVAILSAIW